MPDDKQQAAILVQGAARRGDRAGWIPLRGPSGRLYGYLDPQTQTLELKRKGETAERIDLRALLIR